MLLLDGDGCWAGLRVFHDGDGNVRNKDHVGHHSSADSCICRVASKVPVDGEKVSSDGEYDHGNREERQLGKGRGRDVDGGAGS